MSLSPMMQHYLSIKEQYKDCIVFYRLGDFYEMFFNDAVVASEILDLTLTGKSCGLDERAPMCGVPFHAADLYISKLVAAGQKVAICEQLESADEMKGKIIERDVIKVVTAGTITNSELIDDKKNNFICSVCFENNKIAISWADITTGEFFAKQLDKDDKSLNLINSLVKIAPVEIIANEEAEGYLNQLPLFKQKILPTAQYFLQSEYQIDNSKKTLLEQFNVLSLDVFGLKNNDICICAAGALISYLKQTQKNAIINIKSIIIEDDKEFLMLDATAIRNLDLVKTMRDGKRYGSLLWVLDKAKTSMGARKLQSWILSPLTDKDKINYRLDGVDCLYKDTPTRQSLVESLSFVKDIGRLTGKISNGNLLPKDCVALSTSLEYLPGIKMNLIGKSSQILIDIVDRICDFKNLIQLLNASIVDEKEEDYDGNFKYIKKGFNKELDELRDLYLNSRSKIIELETVEKEKTGIKNLKINYNRVFGYYIEVTNSFKDKVPYEYQRRQTLTNAERYTTEQLKILEEKILSAEESALRLESEIYNKIKVALLEKISQLIQTADAIADLDVICALSTVAREQNYVKPEMVENSNQLILVESRHPVVEAISKQRFVPNDCLLDNAENRTMIITGPNMAGKSTYMRQVALISIMAHIGSFVPAKKAQIPIIDKIFTRIGASDNLIYDQSTFMVEMSEVAYIINNATEHSLLILDEIGRGTSTFDGLSIAWAVVEYATSIIKAKTMFATHYHELTELEDIIKGVKNYKFTVKEWQGSIMFLRKVMRGGANKSFGIEVAELAGVSKDVTDRAKIILKKLENSDITKNNKSASTLLDDGDDLSKTKLTEVEQIISEIDMNNLSPMQAFNILNDLNEKIKG